MLFLINVVLKHLLATISRSLAITYIEDTDSTENLVNHVLNPAHEKLSPLQNGFLIPPPTLLYEHMQYVDFRDSDLSPVTTGLVMPSVATCANERCSNSKYFVTNSPINCSNDISSSTSSYHSNVGNTLYHCGYCKEPLSVASHTTERTRPAAQSPRILRALLPSHVSWTVNCVRLVLNILSMPVNTASHGVVLLVVYIFVYIYIYIYIYIYSLNNPPPLPPRPPPPPPPSLPHTNSNTQTRVHTLILYWFFIFSI